MLREEYNGKKQKNIEMKEKILMLIKCLCYRIADDCIGVREKKEIELKQRS